MYQKCSRSGDQKSWTLTTDQHAVIEICKKIFKPIQAAHCATTEIAVEL